MIPNAARVLTACLLLPLFGCSANQKVIRGQSNSGYLPNASTATDIGFFPTGQPAQGGEDCWNGMCPECCESSRSWSPPHNHTYSYRPPQDVVYPSENQPTAIYQYPYYTVKSPTDFFYK